MSKGWIGFDLDGTLCTYDGWKGHENIGKPLWGMIRRLKEYVEAGHEVRIFTARVGQAIPEQIEPAKESIRSWCKEYIGYELKITSEKDQFMIRCYDDRAKQCLTNQGAPLVSEIRDAIMEFESGEISLEDAIEIIKSILEDSEK
jgi:hypothetical protein